MKLINCSQRQRQLLNQLLVVNDWISGTELSGILHVTDRTIRKDIIELNAILAQHHSTILSERGRGYFLKTNDKKYLLSTLNNAGSPTEKENRIYEITLMLALHPEGVDLYDIEDELFISRTTLEKELKIIQNIIYERYSSISLKRESGFIQLVGSERFIRFFINYVLMKSYNHQTGSLSVHSKSLDTIRLSQIRDIVLDTTFSFGITLSDYNLMDLVIHLSIIELRVSKQKYIHELGSARDNKDYSFLDTIAQQLIHKLFIYTPLPEDSYVLEYKQLAVKLSFINLGNAFSPLPNSSDELISEQILHVVNRLISQINDEFLIDLGNDDEFFSGLILHIKTLLNCYKYNQQTLNPLTDIVKKDYPFAFELSFSIYNIFFEEFGIRLSESELTYIATHIGASIERINSEYGKNNVRIAIITNVPTSYTKLFSSKISSICGNRGKIIGAFPVHKLQDVIHLNPDLIISTCSIDSTSSIPILPIGFSISGAEKIMLETTFDNVQKKWMLTQGAEEWLFTTKFRKELFISDYDANSAEDVMLYMSKIMEKNGYVFHDFYNALLEREKISSSVLANTIAIPHPLDANALTSVIGVVTLKRPIFWRDTGHKVQLVFIMAIRKSDKPAIRNFFNYLSTLIDDKQKVKNILNCKKFEDFLLYVKS